MRPIFPRCTAQDLVRTILDFAKFSFSHAAFPSPGPFSVQNSAVIKSGILSVKGNLASGKISSKKYIITVSADGTLTLAKEKNKDEVRRRTFFASNLGMPRAHNYHPRIITQDLSHPQ
jgi:hypothetical protein